jgi:hypothetical protein
MKKVFDRLEAWAPKKKISMQEENENVVVRRIVSSDLIDIDKINTASIETFDPNEEDRSVATKFVIKYLEENNCETFGVTLDNGCAIRNLLKPKNVELKDFLLS